MTKIYTFYTDTHKKLYTNYFLPSVPDSFEVVVEHFPQECPSGNFHGDGWMNTMRRKVQYVIRAIEENMGGWFIHSDCDIQFFGDFYEDIKKNLQGMDIVAMDDNMLCAGFFACRGSEKMLTMWNDIDDKLDAFANDQFAMNAALINTPGVCFKVLPRFKYFNYMHTVGKDKVWNSGMPIDISRNQLDSIMVHHANYTIGVQNKIEMMEMIKNGKAPENTKADTQMGT